MTTQRTADTQPGNADLVLHILTARGERAAPATSEA